MKKTDLEKNKALDLMRRMKQAGSADRYGSGSAQLPDRREQRRLDQAKGLVAFAVKLDGALVAELQSLAAERKTDLNTLVDELLRQALAA